MSESVLPIKIRPHLIPFFYKEFDGIEAKYLNKKVKACKISLENSLGFLIRLSVTRAHLPEKATKLNLYISLNDQEGRKQYTAKMYKYVSGKYSFLSVPTAAQKKINDHLEDYFRIAFIYYVDGAIKFNHSKVDQAINDFMIEYELDNYGYNLEMLRRYRSRALKKNHKLSRLQVKTSNRIKNSIPVFAMS